MGRPYNYAVYSQPWPKEVTVHMIQARLWFLNIINNIISHQAAYIAYGNMQFQAVYDQN